MSANGLRKMVNELNQFMDGMAFESLRAFASITEKVRNIRQRFFPEVSENNAHV